MLRWVAIHLHDVQKVGGDPSDTTLRVADSSSSRLTFHRQVWVLADAAAQQDEPLVGILVEHNDCHRGRLAEATRVLERNTPSACANAPLHKIRLPLLTPVPLVAYLFRRHLTQLAIPCTRGTKRQRIPKPKVTGSIPVGGAEKDSGKLLIALCSIVP
jgi:hypothetical protein